MENKIGTKHKGNESKTVTNRGAITPTISIITLNINFFEIHHIKEIFSMDQKNKTQLYVFYKKTTLNMKVYIVKGKVKG